MPTYDYVCNNCGHEWELFQSIKANPKRKCPDCAQLKAKRVIGPGAAIIFKGSGFYQTDYRSSAYKKAAEADKQAQKTAEGKADKQAQKTAEGKADGGSSSADSKAKGSDSKTKSATPKNRDD